MEDERKVKVIGQRLKKVFFLCFNFRVIGYLLIYVFYGRIRNSEFGDRNIELNVS